MKIKNGFVTHMSDGEQLMICVDGTFSGMVRSNSTAGKIIDLLKEETTRDELVDKMLEIYDAEREVIARDVDRIIAQLSEIGAIDD